jgi:hypothetical protein
LPFTDRNVLRYLAVGLSGATMPQSRSVPLHIQLVQMFGPLIPTYNRPETVNVGGKELLSFPLPPDRSESRSAGCRTNPSASFSAAATILLQSGVEALDQSFFGEGFGQEAGRSCLQSSRASGLDRESRDENERHPVSLGEQVGSQLETAHRWHSNIGYHA